MVANSVISTVVITSGLSSPPWQAPPLQHLPHSTPVAATKAAVAGALKLIQCVIVTTHGARLSVSPEAVTHWTADLPHALQQALLCTHKHMNCKSGAKWLQGDGCVATRDAMMNSHHMTGGGRELSDLLHKGAGMNGAVGVGVGVVPLHPYRCSGDKHSLPHLRRLNAAGNC